MQWMKMVLLVLVVLAGTALAAQAAPMPQMELLMEGNIQSTGTVTETGWWYVGDYVAGMGGTSGANIAATTGAIAMGTTAGGSPMQQALSNGLDSFTITTWIKSDVTLGDNRSLFSTLSGSSGINLYAGAAYPGAMTLNIDGNFLWGPWTPKYTVVGEWQFIGLTYDGTQASNNVVWYWVDSTGALQSQTMSLNAGAVAATPTKPIIVGGEASTARINAVIDDFRVWGSPVGQGAGAVLDAAAIAEVMATHTPVPEPITMVLLGLGVLGLRRR